MTRVLLIEDDRKAARLLTRGLQEEGFDVDVAPSGEEGDARAGAGGYDVIVLDWMLPGKSGLSVCRDLRARGVATPILMLTARDALSDRVSGLNTGADDYLTKPFAFSELLARLHALLRRADLTRPALLTVADLTLDPVSHRVTRAAVPVSLTPKEYAILDVLVRHAGHVVSRARLAEALADESREGMANVVDVHVSHLRRKLEPEGAAPLIQTVRGRGYRLGASTP